jgi:hypothetical protein
MSSEYMESATVAIIVSIFFLALLFRSKKSKTVDVFFGIFCIASSIALLASILFMSFQSGHIYLPINRVRREASIDDPMFFIAIFTASALCIALVWLGISSLRQSKKRR